ncbi:MAG: hypothetical protein IT170_09420 [Bryobacterales bacterium]|nr:hypothetical protein [Bryobacterales bacterium]
MRRDWMKEAESEDAEEATGIDPFLQKLRERMEQVLLRDAEDPKKVSLGDYLKLAALLEMAHAAAGDGLKEVVVRWEDPSGLESEDAG